MMNRKIPKKNYIILGIVIIFSFFLMYYAYMWYEAYVDNKLNQPILDRYMDTINSNELDNYLVENVNAIIYVSVLEDINVREFEKKVKNLYRRKEITRDILYMDVTNNTDMINTIVSKYSNGVFSSVSLPVMIVIEDKKLKSIYYVKEDNYDIDRFKEFVEAINFLEEDEING